MNPKNTVLIVDDQPSAREVLRALLHIENYTLAFANNGLEALEKAAELIPDLVILDVMMPDLDGFAVCRQLRADPLLAEVPVIMLTTLEDRASRLQGLEAGADDFISKPFDPLELRIRIRTILQLNRYRRLHSERTKFEWVVEKANDGFLIVADRDECITYANARARAYLELPPDGEAPVGESFLDAVSRVFHCEPQEIWQNWKSCLTAENRAYLIRPESAQTRARWLQVDQVAISNGGNAERLVQLRDISDRFTAERLMWNFNNQVSHKLRTPLTLLSGHVELLAESKPDFTGQQQKSFGVIQNSIAKLQMEINGIFRFLQAPFIAQTKQEGCTVADVLTVINEIILSAEVDRHRLVQDGSLGRNAHLSLSRRAIELILWELGENAEKFHPTREPNLEFKLTLATAGLILQISDDGRTLAPDELARIWTPYYQAEKSFTGQVTGMGLGLAMVATLVWEAGGICRAYNRPDRVGLVIELLLPWGS